PCRAAASAASRARYHTDAWTITMSPVPGDLGDVGQVSELADAGLGGEGRQRRPGRGPRSPRLLERGADPPECPAPAYVGGGLERFRRSRSRAALQRDQVEVAGERVPEIRPLLGRIDPRHQVRGA